MYTEVTWVSRYQTLCETVIRLIVGGITMVYALYLLLEKGRWQLSGHIFMLSLCIFIWTNLIIYTAGMNLVLLQLSLIVISSSFYILGKNWGILYSLINVLPIVLHMVTTNFQQKEFSITPMQLHNSSYMLAFIVNFGILIMRH